MGAVIIGSSALSIGQQFTGINAIMNYAPQITKAAGMSPMLGNFAVMLWNFVTTLVSIPLAQRFSRRQMYLTGLAVASLSCLLTGIPTFPSLHVAPGVRHALSGVGIAIFIMAFEIALGPLFYVLATELFPSHFRDRSRFGCKKGNFFRHHRTLFLLKAGVPKGDGGMFWKPTVRVCNGEHVGVQLRKKKSRVLLRAAVCV